MSSSEIAGWTHVGPRPVVDMTRSPHAALRPVGVSAVTLTDTFWEPRLRLNREVTIPSQLKHCEETGRIDNFRRASGKKQIDFQGIYFNDSDVYKWAEAAAWSLATHPDPKLEADLDAVIEEIAAAQDADGYLNTYFSLERKPERFTNLKDMHEIYCAGHLIQGAVAHHRATGKRSFLDIACRLADHLYDTFGPGRRVGACGHEEAEMGLVELYRETGEARYLELAGLMIEARGHKPPVLGGSTYHQDHQPFSEQSEMIGHAVRHLYLCCGAADVTAETGSAEYRRALDTLWQNFTKKKMYVTGGAGSRWEGEAFGADYELPNERAYTETCAAIGSVMWNWRMLHLSGQAQFADHIETTLYNAVLPGLSLDGREYFYQNPLTDRGKHRRQEWFGCACCPPNVARLLASLPGYFYSVDDDDNLYVNLYAANRAAIPLPGGETVTVEQETDYPWDGTVTLTLKQAPSRSFTLFLRVPEWAEEAAFTVNGQPSEDVEMALPGFYARIEREWKSGDVVEMRLPMPARLRASHPFVTSNRGRAAIQRGPLVYCLEQADHEGSDVWDIVLPSDVCLTPERRADLLNGVVTLKGEGLAKDHRQWEDDLYAPYHPADETGFRPVKVTAIPYYAWANRASGPMQVWIPMLDV